MLLWEGELTNGSSIQVVIFVFLSFLTHFATYGSSIQVVIFVFLSFLTHFAT